MKPSPDDESPTAETSAASPRHGLRASSLAIGLACGLLAAVVLLLALTIARRSSSAPLITRTDLEAAAKKWADQGPRSYDMDLMIGGRQPGPVHIEVRDGAVTRMTRNGVVPSQERTWEYWTVPEQFETIRQDFDSAETPGGFGAAAGAETMIKAEFDPTYGYPRRYQRFVLGTDLNVDWEVTAFAAKAEP